MRFEVSCVLLGVLAGCDFPEIGGDSGGPSCGSDEGEFPGECTDEEDDWGTPPDAGTGWPGVDVGGGGPSCGNGVVEGGEECDDANAIDGDGCDNDCTLSRVVDLDAGDYHTCALLDSGAVRCWGSGNGALGLANTATIGDDEVPASVPPVDVGDAVVQITAGSDFTCGVTASADVRCWGLNANGQLGLGHTSNIGDDEHPSAAGPSTLSAGSVVQVAAGLVHACAVYDDGEVACWGANDFGPTGYGSYDAIGDNEAVSSAPFVDVPGTVLALDTGASHTCAVLDTHALRCWGRGTYGALGLGNQSTIGDLELPSSVGEVPVNYSVASVAGGGSHTCVQIDSGDLKCWGLGASGQLGYSNTAWIGDDEALDYGTLPLFEIGQPSRDVAQIVTGANHSCLRFADGGVRCWGDGGNGKLGQANTDSIGDDEYVLHIDDIDLGGPAIDITAGGHHTCALLADGGVRCWGLGFTGALGYGNTAMIGDDEAPSTAGDVQVF